MSKASTNCWTCKQRKVGCDRTLPTCINCAKGRRACEGYGLRLAWPDKHDGRRKQKQYGVNDQHVATKYLPHKAGCFTFLNTVVEDLDGSKISVPDLIKAELSSVISNIPTQINRCSINEQDGMLLAHYDSDIARITTTIDDETNGFRLALIPMALSSSDLCARSILNSTLAIACYHLGRPQQALNYKFRAIRALSDSFAKLSIDTVDTVTKTRHFAASMMLCVYGVFDESDTAWHMHLEGAKSVYATISEVAKNAADFQFLTPWFQYHNIFSQYTYPPRTAELDITLPDCSFENRKIIGVLGCSTEVLYLIGCINQIRGLRLSECSTSSGRSRSSSPYAKCAGTLSDIERRLLNLQQELHIHPGSTSGTIDTTRITFTAELYRIAAVLYFYQAAPTTFIPSYNPQELLLNGLNILWEMKICSSPWPLFILACSVTEDADRIRILGLMETSGSSRRIGNYSIIIGLVKAVWKRQDLCVDDKEKQRVDWRSLVEDSGFMPSFI